MSGKTCFFISRIAGPDTPDRKDSDKLLNYIIEPVLQRCGYGKAVRGDQITQPGVITSQTFTRLWRDDLAIADLTGGNPNVYYELAIRHLSRKPCVQMIRKGETLPFDVAGHRTIYFDFDVEAAERTRQELEAMIQAAEQGLPDNDPAALAIDISALEASANPLERSVTQILSALQALRSMLENVQHVSQASTDIEGITSEMSPWIQILVTELSRDHIGLLLNVYSARRWKPNPASLDRLRTLRDRGLLVYDGSTMATSNEVWLTPLGNKLAETLLGTPPVAGDTSEPAVS